MKTWMAFFRGINVGGKVLPMKALTAILEAAGCREVRTYVQSGNAVFRHAAGSAAQVSARVRAAVAKAKIGFEPQVLILDRKELQKAAAANPFPEAVATPRSLHLFFLAARPPKPDLTALEDLRSGKEAFVLSNKVFYLLTPDGFGISKLAQRVERSLGIEATARNWRTVNAVLELANSEK